MNIEIPELEQVMDLVIHSLKVGHCLWHLFLASLTSYLAVRCHYCMSLPQSSCFEMGKQLMIVSPHRKGYHCVCAFFKDPPERIAFLEGNASHSVPRVFYFFSHRKRPQFRQLDNSVFYPLLQWSCGFLHPKWKQWKRRESLILNSIYVFSFVWAGTSSCIILLHCCDLRSLLQNRLNHQIGLL